MNSFSGGQSLLAAHPIKVNQPADRSPCAHQDLTLKGIDLKRSTERDTCNACGKPIVRTLKTSVSYWLAPDPYAADESIRGIRHRELTTPIFRPPTTTPLLAV